MGNPMMQYGGGDRSTDASPDAPAQTAGRGYVPTVPEAPLDPVIDETMVDPGAAEAHVTDLFNVSHDARMSIHGMNCDALGREHIGAHDFPTLTGH